MRTLQHSMINSATSARSIRIKSQYKKFDLRNYPFLYECYIRQDKFIHKHPFMHSMLTQFVFWTFLASLYFLPRNIGKIARNLDSIDTGMRLRLMDIERQLKKIAEAAESISTSSLKK